VSLSDGWVYAYSQIPNGAGDVTFQEQRVFANDGQPHAYLISLDGADVTFRVDITAGVVESYPVVPLPAFYVATTAHRASAGWSAPGLGLDVGGVSLYE
jgi:hypothetical protein